MCNENSRFWEQTVQQVSPFAVILFQAFSVCSLAGVYNLWLLCVSQTFLPTRRCKRSFNFHKYFILLWPILAFLLFSSFKGWYIFNIFQIEPSTEECEQWQTPPPEKKCCIHRVPKSLSWKVRTVVDTSLQVVVARIWLPYTSVASWYGDFQLLVNFRLLYIMLAFFRAI